MGASKTNVRLLNLFSKASIMSHWPQHKANKEEMVKHIARNETEQDIKKFVFSELTRCKQHVYAFSHDVDLSNLPDSVLVGHQHLQKEESSSRVAFKFILEPEYVVHLTGPYEKVQVPYKWPIMIEFFEGVCCLRFVKLVKNMKAEFGDRYLKLDGMTIDESDLIAALGIAFDNLGGVQVLDLNKGVKELVEEDIIDGKRVRVKRKMSTRTENVDGNYTFKKDLPEEEYKEFKGSPLLNSRFEVISGDHDLEVFSTNPTEGFINFPRYSDEGDTNEILREIIGRNS